MNYMPPNYPYFRGDDNRGLLLPLLVGAAVGFPFGYIASNTSKNNMPYYPPMQMQPYPYYPSYPVMPQPYPILPY